MKLGLIADTHDNVPKIKQAVDIFNQQHIDFLVHCGDFIAPFALIPFEQLSCEWVGVFGNNDGEKNGLIEKSRGRIKQPPYFLRLHNQIIAVTHEFRDYECNILAFGHTHQTHFKKNAKVVINPGEAGGWLYGQSSLAILDLDVLEADIIHF
jgi:hypothetical protein